MGEENFPCGCGMWQKGQTKLFNELWEFEPRRIVASGAWTADDTFTLVARLFETPFYHTHVYHFVGDEMMVETRVNESFGPLKGPLLTARAV
jgi:hypothetical protein